MISALGVDIAYLLRMSLFRSGFRVLHASSAVLIYDLFGEGDMVFC